MGLMTRSSTQWQPPTSDSVRLTDYPHPYPDGWYRLMTSKSLRRGQVRYLECLGRALVVWRSEDGKGVFAMGAFCPHMGANLRHGHVHDDCIECPFHGWRFTGNGQAAYVPYSDSPPTRLAAESFPVQEMHGQIFMFHRNGARQHADDDVPYPAPRIREVDDGSFVFRGHYDGGRVQMHICEFIENVGDWAHFKYLHGAMTIPWTQIPLPGFTIEHEPGWEVDNDHPWQMRFFNAALVAFRGRPLERTRANAVVTFTGPASVVNFRLTIPDVGGVEIVQTHLPVAPLEQQVDFHWFADRKVPRILVRYIVGNWVSQWRQDILIWENKAFLPHPTLSRGDGPVVPVRRWYRQFFPDWQPPETPVETPPEVPRVPAERPLVGAASS